MNRKIEQQAAFDKIYAGLNPKQQLAVDTIEGPVMVIAGPGTGKTQILGARIGKILLETDTAPENILCLTYTDAGAIAMRKRLLSFIGPSAYKVTIATFHSFCNDIIQDNLSLFDKSSLDPISELEKIEVLKELIDAFKIDNPLKRYRGDVYYEMNNLSKLFSVMKKEGWSSEYIHTKVDEYVQSIPFKDEFVYKKKYKQFEAGSLKQAKVDEAMEKMAKLKAAAEAFDHYQNIMQRKNRYDFDDMIVWVLKAFKEFPNLLAQYQERYLYILVDEFQDTSGTQNELVESLISYWEQPNIFVVGDDDQSIYRFQGANVENMLQIKNNYVDDLVAIVLENNYRSSQPILDASTIVINNNNGRLVNQIKGLEKNLIASTDENISNKQKPIVVAYSTPQEEMIDITEQIDRLIASGVPAKEIAVLAKENKYGEQIAHFLQQKSLPIYTKRTANLFDEILIQQILTILKYLAAEWDQPNEGTGMLFEILHFSFFHIQPITIAKLTYEANLLKMGNEKNTFRTVLVEKTKHIQTNLFEANEWEHVSKAMLVLENLIDAIPNVTLINLVEKVLQSTGIIQQALAAPNKSEQLNMLTTFFDFIKEETHRNPKLNLIKLVDIFTLMEKENIRLPLPITTGSDTGVHLLTAHGSKGLEFEYVFLAGTNASVWEKKRASNNIGYTLPDTILTHLQDGGDKEELRRLFYVALTRAKKQVQVSYSNFNEEGKALEQSQFIAEMMDGSPVEYKEITIEQDVINSYKLLHLQTTTQPEIAQLEADFIGPKLEKFSMNVTALNNYLKCPLHFYYNSLIRVPSGKSESTTFGSAVHEALQKLFKKMQERNNQFPDAVELVDDFNKFMHRHREAFTEVEFNRRKEQGFIVLTDYYNKYVNDWNKVVTTEFRHNNVLSNGIPIKGAIDKIEFDNKKAVVVDYKTGNIDYAKDKLLSPNEKNPLGGDYWRQAVFYKILLQDNPKQWEVVKAEFDFVEPNGKKEFIKYPIDITDADITTVKQQIQTTWDKIQARDFYIGCGKSDCHWCNFTKDNGIAIALHELVEEE